MSVQNFFIIWQDIGLILYAILKAFLPLPSLEVILVPLCLNMPDRWLLYSLEGAIGTSIGGSIGYIIARALGTKALQHIATKEDIEKGTQVINKYGFLAIFIGGITPIPDFILAYLAGFMKMNFFIFILSDGFARLLRSIIITYCLKSMGQIIDVEAFGIYFTLFIFIWLVVKWIINKVKIHEQTTCKK
ncbi:MAG: VTT domain-containing protein [Longicatena sp.]